jgi:hypothetical protein
MKFGLSRAKEKIDSVTFNHHVYFLYPSGLSSEGESLLNSLALSEDP